MLTNLTSKPNRNRVQGSDTKSSIGRLDRARLPAPFKARVDHLCTVSLLFLAPLASQLPALQDYPQAERIEHYDDYHGTLVHDPYRWLEVHGSDSVEQWIEEEGALCETLLQSFPGRTELKEQLTEAYDYTKMGCPWRVNKRIFYWYNDGLQNQPVLYVNSDSSRPARVLLDPNILSKEGTTSVMKVEVSSDGDLLVYALSEAGSDFVSVRVLDVNTGENLSDRLEDVKFSSFSWKSDGSGFFYCRYDDMEAGNALHQANSYHRLYFHGIGQLQSEDQLVFQSIDPDDLVTARVIAE
jgi:prolyl oligopeptidase